MRSGQFSFGVRLASLGLLFGLTVGNPVSAAADSAGGSANSDQGAARITVLYGAFGKTSNMQKDWGFSAYIEHAGKKVLFDTGNNADIFAHNVQAKGIDLTALDFVVMSHRHGDHTSGLNNLLKVNPTVKIYVPQENFGVFGAALPGTFFRRVESLPPPRCGISTAIRRSDFVSAALAQGKLHMDYEDYRDPAGFYPDPAERQVGS